MEQIIANVIVALLIIAVIALAIRHIVKAKKSGAHCIGCPSSGSCSKCNCSKEE